jgi:IS5 family transposase
MRPKRPEADPSGDLFRARLDQIINMKHELVLLADRIDWVWLDEEVAPAFGAAGRPGVPTRYMLGLLLLKHIYRLSDEGVCERWVHDPYFQYFTGETFFQHDLPHERSGLTHWRNRLGDRLEALLAESLRIAHDSGALATRHVERVTVDTTVQPKNVTHPTDAKLMYRAIVRLGALARTHGVPLRQSYVRVGKRAQIMAGRYTQTKQFKRATRELRFLRTRLGRLIRDIRRKTEHDPALREIFAIPLGRADQVRRQRQQQRGWKLYSLHAPEVECIGKGKAHKPYEFGCKSLPSGLTRGSRSPPPTPAPPGASSCSTPKHSTAALRAGLRPLRRPNARRRPRGRPGAHRDRDQTGLRGPRIQGPRRS